MYESEIAQLRQIAELLSEAQKLYHESPPPAPVGILLGADLTSAAARTQQLINHLSFLERTQKETAGKRSIFGLAHQARA